MSGRPERAAEAFRYVAWYLDRADEAMGMLAAALGKEPPSFATSKVVQADLLMMASWMDEHPDTDAELMSVVSTFPDSRDA